MPKVRIRELPKNYRIKLTKEQEEQFWNKVRENRTIKEYAETTKTPVNQLYNLKNQNLAYPVKLIIREFNIEELNPVAFKGPYKSQFAKTHFPIKIPSELLTRIKCSVKVNREGTPHYITYEKELVERFQKILQQTCNLDTKIYRNKGRYELRYPKFFHKIIENIEFKEDTNAKIDEIAEIKEEQFKLPNEKIPFDKVKGSLYSREKKLALALYREDSSQVAEIISQETNKINRLIQ